MTAKVAWGWDVNMAVNGFTTEGRLIVVGGGYWAGDQSVSYPGYDGTVGTPPQTQYRADSDLFLDDALHWLAQKAGALNVLVMCTDPPPAGTTGFSSQFVAGLGRLGHFYTLTGSSTTFGGLEPLDYDVVIGPGQLSAFTYHGLSASRDKWDYVLENQGAVLTENLATVDEWERYGIDTGGYESGHSYQRPFSCAPLGVGTYKLVQYTTVYLVDTANTKGGTRTTYYCDTHGTEGVVALWSES